MNFLVKVPNILLSLSLKFLVPIKYLLLLLMAATCQLHELMERGTGMCYFPRCVFASTKRRYVREEMKRMWWVQGGLSGGIREQSKISGCMQFPIMVRDLELH